LHFEHPSKPIPFTRNLPQYLIALIDSVQSNLLVAIHAATARPQPIVDADGPKTQLQRWPSQVLRQPSGSHFHHSPGAEALNGYLRPCICQCHSPSFDYHNSGSVIRLPKSTLPIFISLSWTIFGCLLCNCNPSRAMIGIQCDLPQWISKMSILFKATFGLSSEGIGISLRLPSLLDTGPWMIIHENRDEDHVVRCISRLQHSPLDFGLNGMSLFEVRYILCFGSADIGTDCASSKP
jgi:hypothetical protein